MEQRQPNEPNQSRTNPSDSPKPDGRPTNNQPQPSPEQQPTNQPANNRQGVPFRDNRTGDNSAGNTGTDPANRPERSFKPAQNQRDNRQVNGRNDEQRQKNQRDSRHLTRATAERSPSARQCESAR